MLFPAMAEIDGTIRGFAQEKENRADFQRQARERGCQQEGGQESILSQIDEQFALRLACRYVGTSILFLLEFLLYMGGGTDGRRFRTYYILCIYYFVLHSTSPSSTLSFVSAVVRTPSVGCCAAQGLFGLFLTCCNKSDTGSEAVTPQETPLASARTSLDRTQLSHSSVSPLVDTAISSPKTLSSYGTYVTSPTLQQSTTVSNFKASSDSSGSGNQPHVPIMFLPLPASFIPAPEFFHTLRTEDWQVLSQHSRLQKYSKDEIILREGEKNEVCRAYQPPHLTHPHTPPHAPHASHMPYPPYRFSITFFVHWAVFLSLVAYL